MLGEKESNGKTQWNGSGVRSVLILERNFWSRAAEVCDESRKSDLKIGLTIVRYAD
jgi:hypothetical protein